MPAAAAPDCTGAAGGVIRDAAFDAGPAGLDPGNDPGDLPHDSASGAGRGIGRDFGALDWHDRVGDFAHGGCGYFADRSDHVALHAH